ncbi:SurA N-terminal domain-containing protein [Halobacteriovorax sp.]|uniref:peptidylprolyl isomerase n=1 Tax=Halobacteriovorax sp. TaxID=2020862 RepID=UPI0035652812
MSENETTPKKSSSIFVTIFIGLIVVSFMFTGYQSMTTSPNSVAKVGSELVSIEDYQREYNRQLEFYRGLFGGKDLTTQQIQQFRIKETALRNLVQLKLTLILGDKIGVIPSSEEVKAEIKKLPYFQVNGQFSISRYKNLLAANSMNPTQFEETISDQVRGTTTDAVFTSMPISESYFKDINKFKDQKIQANIIEIDKEALRKKISVSKEEITKYLAEETNSNRVSSLFNDRKSSLDQKEQVKARHILFKTDGKNDKQKLKAITTLRKKLTTRNFISEAKKHTEEEAGKSTGGDLKWFPRGAMVPEFDKAAFSMKPGTISSPIKSSFGYHIIFVEDKKEEKLATLADHQDALASELIRNTKNTELEALAKEATEEVLKVASSTSKLNKLKKKYGIKIESSKEINKLDGSTGQIQLEAANLNEIFKSGIDQDKTYTFDRASNIVVVKSSKFDKKDKANTEEIEEANTSLKNILSRKLKQDILKDLEASVTVKDFGVL